jgi:antitoxin ParD1/3/4
MPIRNVNLTDEPDRFIMATIESGRYKNASEVAQAALRRLKGEEQGHEARRTALCEALDAGNASGAGEDNPLARVGEELQ